MVKLSKSPRHVSLISIKRSTKPDKKYMATFERHGRQFVMHFGQRDANDYIRYSSRFSRAFALHKRNGYIFRHHKDLRGDPSRAGYLSMYVLWNKPSLLASIDDYRKRLAVFNRTGVFPTQINGYVSPGKTSKYQ
jgi:hypothetical protein